jgi:hypothetical protein
VQTHAPEAMRGRVLSTVFAVFGGTQAIGMLLAGLAGTGAGLMIALQVQGTTILLAALLAVGLDRRAASDPEPLRGAALRRTAPRGLMPEPGHR